jgi:peptide chain release factor 1
MIEKLIKAEREYEKLNEIIADPQNISNPGLYQKYIKQQKSLQPLIDKWNEYKKIMKEIADVQKLIDGETDNEMRKLEEEELEVLEGKKQTVERELEILLTPKNEEDNRNVIMEIRAGTGGDESSLFVADLFKMYGKYIQSKGWKLETISSHPTGIGGFKEIIFAVEGKNAYLNLKHERGVHRVQRIPQTESSGRIHTSAATVAVLPEAGEVEVEINPNDLRIDVFRSSGPGGQSVNTTDSAVRITHLPTGIVVTCQDEKSQHKNKAKALRVLRARLLNIAKREQEEKIAKERRMQIGSGDRSEKVRTYNFPQNRVTDHRSGLTLYKLESVLNGELDEIIESLMKLERKKNEKSNYR